ncbi:hypothetical protein OHA19_10545 [Streptomyces sp. NBC_00012]|uniref:hypothetical protein n=1 Tax=Streptomyces sp. NBC_00012 TaxID=2975621 RepID=UPI0032527C79
MHDQEQPVDSSGCVIAMDLGGRRDASAAAILVPDADGSGVTCTYATRFPLRAQGPEEGYYRTQARHLASMVTRALAATSGPVRVLLDVTRDEGGREIFTAELPRDHRVEFWPVWITSGTAPGVARDGRRMVPKAALVNTAKAAFSRQRPDGGPWVAIAEFPEAEVLRRELTQFAARTTAAGNTVFEARKGHDDLAIALLMALYGLGQDTSARVVCNPANYDQGRSRNLLMKNPRFSGQAVDLEQLPTLTSAATRHNYWGGGSAASRYTRRSVR